MNTNSAHRHKIFLVILFTLFISKNIYPQLKEPNSSEIYSALKKLNVVGSVLYIAAHPDDENNAVLTYMSKEKLVRTGYFSLTRGDGGQNLLGSEKGDLLGVIRTQELLSARKIDGAEQFFSRAIDFGFSKTPEETLKNWDKELVLSDVVKVIRQFKPDVIITRFSKTLGGHGHHLASAILAEEAFYAAANPKKFPEQLSEVNVWQAKRIVWDSFNAGQNALPLDIGIYNSILGKSYNEIAGESRTMHKTQGFGVALSRGTQNVVFEHTAGDTAKSSLFDGIDLTWNRVEGGSRITESVNEIIKNYNFENPAKSIASLVNLYNNIDKIKNRYWAEIKKKEVKEIIRMCAGLWIESIIWQPGTSPGKNIEIRSMLVNRSNVEMKLSKINFSYSKNDSLINQTLQENNPLSIKTNITIPDDAEFTQPYWLKEKNDGKMFVVTDSKKIGKAESEPAIIGSYFVKINNTIFEYNLPVMYRWTDAVEGEKYRPFIIRPKVSITTEEKTLVFPDESEREINVTIKAKEENQKGKLFAETPKGWKVFPEFFDFNISDEGGIKRFSFKVLPEKNADNGTIKFKAEIENKIYADEVIEIDYPHIKFQSVLVPAETKVVKLDIKLEPRKIGYIMGSGDEIPVALSQLGYKVDLLSDEDLDNKDFSEYDVIITGIRAFNVRGNLDRQQKRIMKFVENGGTWVAQHNTRFGIQVPQIGPYTFPVAGRDRVAEENAEVQILIPDHQIFNSPNKITKYDFNGWVQERGVNFADSWGGKLYPLLSTNDAGEPSKMGGLLYARYGEGIFIYTAFSWFRQLPAGVKGAYRLFVNIISTKRNSN